MPNAASQASARLKAAQACCTAPPAEVDDRGRRRYGGQLHGNRLPVAITSVHATRSKAKSGHPAKEQMRRISASRRWQAWSCQSAAIPEQNRRRPRQTSRTIGVSALAVSPACDRPERWRMPLPGAMVIDIPRATVSDRSPHRQNPRGMPLTGVNGAFRRSLHSDSIHRII